MKLLHCIESNDRQIELSPNGKLVASYTHGSPHVRIWNVDSGNLVKKLETQFGVVNVAWSANNNRIATSVVSDCHHYVDMHDIIYDVKRTIFTIFAGIGHSYLSWSRDGNRVAIGCENMLRVIDVQIGKTVMIFEVDYEQVEFTGEMENTGITAVAWSPNGESIAAGMGAGGKMYIWNLATNVQVCTIYDSHETDDMITAINWSPDSTRILTCCGDQTTQLWDARTCRQIGNPLTGHDSWKDGVYWGPEDQVLVASGAVGGNVIIRDLAGAQIGEPMVGHRYRAYDIRWSTDGTRIVSSSDYDMRIWSGRGIASPDPHA